MRLDCVQTIRDELKEIEQRLECLKAISYSVRISAPDGLPRAKSQSSHVEKVAVEIADMENRRDALLAEMVDAMLALTDEIWERVKDSKAAQVLCCRYALGYTFKRIQRETGFSDSTVFYLHRSGKREFEKAGDEK